MLRPPDRLPRRLPPRRAVLAGLLAAIGGLLLVLVTPGVASAHAVVVSSTPAEGQVVSRAPAQAQIQFSEPVSADLGGLTVLDSSGQRVDDGNSQVVSPGDVLQTGLNPDLPDGTYVMNYRVISADGHPISGAIVFGIGSGTQIDAQSVKNLKASGSPGYELAAGVARFVTYLAALLAAGLAVFLAFVHDQRADRWKLAPIVRISAVVGGIGAIAVVAIQAAIASNQGISAMTDPSTLRQALTQGLDWMTVALLLGLAVVHLSTDTQRLIVAQALAFYGALAVALSFVFWGHSTESSPRWLALTADGVHTAAAAVWLGGLVGVALTLWRRRRGEVDGPVTVVVDAPDGEGGTAVDAEGGVGLQTAEGATLVVTSDRMVDTGDITAGDEPLVVSTARIVARFSTLAGATLVALVAAGTALAWVEVESVGNLTTTDYGRLLIAKVAVVAVIIGVAAFNRYRLVPYIEVATDPDRFDLDDDVLDEVASVDRDGSVHRDVEVVTRGWQRLIRAMSLEVAGIVVVLAITAVLVNVTPAKTAVEIGGVTNQTVPVGPNEVNVVVAPGTVGANQIHIQYLDDVGRPITYPKSAKVELSQPDEGVGPIEVDLTDGGGGHFWADVASFPTSGKWDVTVISRISDFEQIRTTIPVTIGK